MIEEKAAKIIEECGFIKKFIREIDINDEIRELEEIARRQRPLTAKSTEPLTRFLSADMAKKLQDLRKERLKNRDEIDKSLACSKKRISEEGIVLIKTKKGIFAEKKKPEKEEEKGLAKLFG